MLPSSSLDLASYLGSYRDLIYESFVAEQTLTISVVK